MIWPREHDPAGAHRVPRIERSRRGGPRTRAVLAALHSPACIIATVPETVPEIQDVRRERRPEGRSVFMRWGMFIYRFRRVVAGLAVVVVLVAIPLASGVSAKLSS